MTEQKAKALLERFQQDEDLQASLRDWVNLLTEICAAGAMLRGFHEDEKFLRAAAEHGLLEYDVAYLDHEDTCRPPRCGKQDEHLAWFDNQILQAELARQASEIGEAVEAVRKPGPDPHCPAFSNFLIEEADCVIRIGDTCGKREMPLGDAIVAKLLYNMSRPFKHGKNS